jgi:hypothetical protein
VTLYDITSHIIDAFVGKCKGFGMQIANVLRFHGSGMESGALFPLSNDCAPDLQPGKTVCCRPAFFFGFVFDI